MLVQLSPWQTCSTSVPVSTRRRRKRSDASLPSSEAERVLEVEASFVTTTQRHRKKKKLHTSFLQQQQEPVVAVTASHRISIVGRAAADATHELHECRPWQFRSHPGRTTSFVQEQANDSNTRIPAIMDARNDCMYALQNENKTLACWNVNASSGPDDVDAPAIKIKLAKPAVSLSTLVFQKGVAFGTCADGSLFVTKQREDGSLQVEYSKPVHESSKDYRHVFTSVQAASGHANARAGQKRKASHEQGDFVFYQVFSKANRVFIYKRKVNLANMDGLNDGSNVQVSSVDVLSGDMHGKIVDHLSFSCSRVDDSTIAIVFVAERGENGSMSEERHYYCAPIDIETGQQRRNPFQLANFTRHAGAVTPSLLAVARLDEILLYDLVHGAVVSRSSVTDVVGDCKNWSITTETRKGRIAVVSVQNGYAHVAFARVLLDDISYQQATSQGNGYNLAVGLRSSLASQSTTPLENTPTTSFQKSLLDLSCADAESEDSKRQLDDCVLEALVGLERCIDEIRDPDNTDIQPFYFMNEYERAIASILDASLEPLSPPRPTKCSAPKQQKKVVPLPNGVHHAEASDSTLDTEATSSTSKTDEVNGSTHSPVNGLKVPTKVVRGNTPSDLPQQFVDGATSIVLSVLQLPLASNKAVGIRSKLARLDARLILSGLVRTGKVSARRHFDQGLDLNDDETFDYFFSVLRSLKLSKKGGNRVFSPVDLVHEMITWCADISERQMVTMIHFVLCKALPEDIAENFLDEGNLQAGHPYRVLAKKFIHVRSSLRKQQTTAKVGTEEVSKLREQEESLSLKLVRAGTAILVGRLARYSRCNETLLRNAMAEGLTGRHEPTILARVLLDLLDDHGKNELIPSAPPDFAPLMTKWIFTLCEACRDRLVGESDGESPLSLILTSVRAAVKSSEAVMTLHDAVYKFGTSKSDDDKEGEEDDDDETADLKKLAASASASHTREGAPVPFYSIERLAF